VDIVALKNPILRFTAPYNTFDTIADMWSTTHSRRAGLSDGEIRDLAMKIANKSSSAAPFFRWATFLNRRLVNDSTQPYYTSAGAYNNFVRAPSLWVKSRLTPTDKFSAARVPFRRPIENQRSTIISSPLPQRQPRPAPASGRIRHRHPTGDYTAVVESAGGFGNHAAGAD